jgi:ribosomal protein S18 acetylase RimI-like enzyme
MNSTLVRHATDRDLAGIVLCHEAAFPGTFMAELRSGCLGALYKRYLKHESGLSLVGVNGREFVLGFAVGGAPQIRNDFFRRTMVYYIPLIAWKSLTNPVVRRRVLGFLGARAVGRRVERDPTFPHIPRTGRTATLLSIGVLPEVRGSGLADELIETFRIEAGRRGFERLELSVRSGNTRAVAFYKKHGWHEIGRFGARARFAIDCTRAEEAMTDGRTSRA